jgi:23S rRNA (adenine2030-N6)-methyltransferase
MPSVRKKGLKTRVLTNLVRGIRLNYRHRYHAGNPADVLKHATLTALIPHLRRKPKPMTIFDTHAGVGIYDLKGEEAVRTAEAEGGIGRLLARPQHPAIDPYLDIVRAVAAEGGMPHGRLYPGSPEIIRRLMGEEDRLITFERHPEDFRDLKRVMSRDHRVACHCRDAYEGLQALTPPMPRRGLALIDPPFERPDEFQAVLQCLTAVGRRWPVGMVAVWYPIKERGPVDAFLGEVAHAGATGVLVAELSWAAAADAGRLSGAGIVIINAPYQFDEMLAPVLDAVAAGLEAANGPSIRWLVRRR